jgi:hypothetical protein
MVLLTLLESLVAKAQAAPTCADRPPGRSPPVFGFSEVRHHGKWRLVPRSRPASSAGDFVR